jgi:hypothetical protein
MAFTEFLIPFFFMFAVAYGGLEVSDVLKNRKINLVLGVVFGLFAASNPGTVDFINEVLPYAVILLVIFFFLGFLLSFVRGKGEKGKKDPDYTLIIIIAGLAMIFLSSDNSLLSGLPISLENWSPWIMLVFILVVFMGAYYKSVGKTN